MTNPGYNVFIEQHQIEDPAGALAESNHADNNPYGCSPAPRAMSMYGYHASTSSEFENEPNSHPLVNGTRDIANATGKFHGGVCTFALHAYMISPMMTMHTSSHGITTLQILLDEGGILGAILFVTWFFGIFATGARTDEEETGGKEEE
jgi:hypothetical protein